MSRRFWVNLITIAVTIWATGLAGEAAGQVSSRPPFIEDEVGDIRIGRDTADDVIKCYGHGIGVPGTESGFFVERLCYWDPSRQVGVQFEPPVVVPIKVVIVTSQADGLAPVCRVRPIKITSSLTTGKMISLGDSPEKVVSIYGAPRKKMEVELQGRKWIFFEYEGQHERTPGEKQWYFAGVGFVDGKLGSLMILESEQQFTKLVRGDEPIK